MHRFLFLSLVLILTFLGSASALRAGSGTDNPNWSEGPVEIIISTRAFQPPSRGTYRIANFGAGRETGEPNPAGKMNKTVWGRVNRAFASRMVIHTYGSGFDTALAVYTGSSVNALTLVKFNDDKPVAGLPGLTSKQSLVQFDAAANVRYLVQFGSADNAEGVISANAFAFPPGGGLAAFLIEFLGNTTWGNRDATCGNAELLLQCTSAKFIIHNSTNQTLNVISSSSLGPGVSAPAPFLLTPGEVKTAQFTFTAAFDRTTPRATPGEFLFVGRSNGTEITRTAHRALVVIENNSTGLGNVLRADVTPTIRAGWLNEGRNFVVKLTNTGAQNANRCHARTETFSHLKTQWQSIDPTTGDALAPLNQPVNITAGQTKWLRVTLASQESRVADPEFPADITLDCVNTDPAPINLSNAFDLSASGVYRPLQMTAAKLAPAGDTLNVPAAGGVFRVSAKNLGATTTLRALTIYLRPFGEPPNKEFTVKICRTATDGGACLQQPSGNSVEYSHPQNATAFFKIFVTRPAVDPGYNPAKRRVFFKIWQDQPTSGSFDAVVAAGSVAVKRN